MHSKIQKYVGVLITLLFFIIGIVTLPDYGINWDTINHLPRGQAYLSYYLTGNKDYSHLPPFEKYWQDESTLIFDSDVEGVPRRSLYQNNSVPYSWFVEHDGGGHPPTSDIISSFFNYVLFQKLGIINDIDSYRVYGIVVASLLVYLVYWWTAKKTNIVGGIAAALSLATYPLFFAESHFNAEKDIPETVFWSFLIYSFYRGVHQKSVRWILLSGVFGGLALGTKFNILFVVFILVPWLLFVVIRDNWPISSTLLKRATQYKSLIISIIVAPIISFVVFVAFWPYLWSDIISNLQTVVDFYKSIGTTAGFDSRFISIGGINTYPIIWIISTTPIVVLLLSTIGSFTALQKVIRGKDDYYLLLLLWLVIPIARVTVPGSNIYGGVRQIMEYIPAMAILAGVGMYSITVFLKDKVSQSLFFAISIILFIPHIVTLSAIHPNQNVYFNQLIGGLSGAKARDIPSWGNSFGAAYRQGVAWINDNAEENSNVVYAFELIPNIPSIWFRRDLTLWNVNRSGFLANGEYAITLTYDGTDTRSYYDTYLELFVEPSFTVDVDDVSILKVWHNTPESQKYTLQTTSIDVVSEIEENTLTFDLGRSESLNLLTYQFDERSCENATSLYVEVSADGKTWKRLPGLLPNDWLIPYEEFGSQPKDGVLKHPFAGTIARYIRLTTNSDSVCELNPTHAEVTYFEDIPQKLRQDLLNLY